MDEEVKYKWTATDSNGEAVSGFGNAEDKATTWSVPATPGIYTLTCTIDDPHKDTVPTGQSVPKNSTFE